MEEQLQKQTGFAAGRAASLLGVCSTHKEPFVSPYIFTLSFQAAAAARPCASLWDRGCTRAQALPAHGESLQPALHGQVVLAGMGWDGVGSPAQVCRGARAAPGHARSPSGQEGLTSITALPLPCCWLAGHATQKYCREFLIEVLLGEIKQ